MNSKKSAAGAATGKNVGYVRVSSDDQNDARQLDGIELDKIFTDKASGKNLQRPQFQAMVEFLRDGDHLHVHSMDRLSRSLKDLQDVVETLTAKGVAVSFLKEGLTFQKPTEGAGSHKAAYDMLMLQMLGAVGQFERSLIRERQREGIAIAKAKGIFKGRKPALNATQQAQLRLMAIRGDSKSSIAATLGISRSSVYHYLGTKNTTP